MLQLFKTALTWEQLQLCENLAHIHTRDCSHWLHCYNYSIRYALIHQEMFDKQPGDGESSMPCGVSNSVIDGARCHHWIKSMQLPASNGWWTVRRHWIVTSSASRVEYVCKYLLSMQLFSFCIDLPLSWLETESKVVTLSKKNLETIVHQTLQILSVTWSYVVQCWFVDGRTG